MQRLWKKRIAFLLVASMLLAQLCVPTVNAQPMSSGEESTSEITKEIPEEYLTFGEESVLDLTKPADNSAESLAKAGGDESIPEEYKTIPIIGSGVSKAEDSAKEEQLNVPESMNPESQAQTIPIIMDQEALPSAGDDADGTAEDSDVGDEAQTVTPDVATGSGMGVGGETTAPGDSNNGETIPEDNISLDEITTVDVIIPGGINYYYFTPEETGDYVLAAWADGEYFYPNLWVDQLGGPTVYSQNGFGVMSLKLTAGVKYQIRATSAEQGTYFLRLSSLTTIGQDSGEINSGEVYSAAVYKMSGDVENGGLVTLSIASESQEDYSVSIDGQTLAAYEDGTYKFFMFGDTDVVIWKKNSNADVVTISTTTSDIDELFADGIGDWQKQEISLNTELNNSNRVFLKFKPNVSGHYAFMRENWKENGTYISYFLYEVEGNAMNHVTSGSNILKYDFEEGKTYYMEISAYDYSESWNLILAKTETYEAEFGTKLTIPAAGKKFISIKYPTHNMGLYKVQIKGTAEKYGYMLNPGEIAVMDSVNGGTVTRILYANGDTNSKMVVYPYNSEDSLDALEILVEEAECSVELDEEGYYRGDVGMSSGGVYWMEVTPAKSGSYVLCTEEKYSKNYIAGYLYNEEFMTLNGAQTSDNLHLAYQLEAGKKYYYQIHMPFGEDVAADNFRVVLYPETTVTMEGTQVTTPIRKAVAYQIEVPKAGFYKLGVNGNDESYFLSIGKDGMYDSNTHFVYKDIPRTFQFASKGTYTVWVMKELMSDEADEITFTYTTEGALLDVSTEELKQVDIEQTEGAWVRFVPDQTGWYGLYLKDEYSQYYTEISVESEDGSAIVYESYLDDVYDEDGQVYVYKLLEGRTYYYKISSWWDMTGTTYVRMYMPESTVTVSDETTSQSYTLDGKLAVLKTNFSEKQYYSISEQNNNACYIREVTDGVNSSSFTQISSYRKESSIVIFPEGEHEYLIFTQGNGEKTVEIAPKELTQGGENSKLQLTFTESNSSKWIKIEPQTDGIYTLGYMYGNVKITTSLYMVKQDKLSDCSGMNYTANGNAGFTAYLQAGETYFVEMSGRIAEETAATCDVVLYQPEIGSFGTGEHEISMKGGYVGKNTISESGYYQIEKAEDEQDLYFKWFTCKNDKVSNQSVSKTVTGSGATVFLSGKQVNTDNTYVQIYKGSYTDEPESVQFSVKKAELLTRDLAYGETITEEASGNVKEYHITPESTGVYSFIFTSDEVGRNHTYATRMLNAETGAEVSKGSSSHQNLTNDTVSYYRRDYTLEGGVDYTLYVEEKASYALKFTTTKTRLVYDYDEYTAFIASGGTVNIVTELTDEMYEKLWDGYADYWSISGSYAAGNREYLYLDASNFKDKSNIWIPYEMASYHVEDDSVTYQSIKNMIGDYYLQKKLVKMYEVSNANLNRMTEAALSKKIASDNQIILAYYEPNVVLIQKITLQGLAAMEVGQKTKITATTSTLNKYQPTNPNITFTSSNPSVLHVDHAGNVTAKKEGTATIICKSADGNAEARLNVTVKNTVVYVSKVTITGANELYVGDRISLQATTDTNGKGAPTLPGVTWTSSDEQIATVDAEGNVTGKAAGTVTITAASKDGKAKASIVLTVKPILASKVTLNESSIRMKKGTSYKWLEVEIKPADTTDKSLTWTSSNSKVATVSAKGVIKAKAVGKTTITVETVNGKKDTVKVTVTASDIKVKKVSVEKKMTVVAGDKVKLKPTVTPVNATNQKLEYTSSNKKIATVNSKGVVTTKADGKVKITIKAKDGSKKKATCTITVKKPDAPKLNSVTSKKAKTALVTWEKVDHADGYVVYMSTSKKGKYSAVATIKKASTTSCTVKKLKNKKTYYFKVVSYVKASGKKIYSKASKVKSIKLK